MKILIKNVFSLWPFCNLICWHGRRSCRKVALTFDDGPRVGYTKRVLEILKREDVKATFFLEGCWVEKNLGLVRDIIAAGHEVGNHGYDHGGDDVFGQFIKGSDILEGMGIVTRLFRPALGKIGLIDLARLWFKKSRVVLWSFDTHDSMRHEGKWGDGKLDYSAIRGGDVILMHDDNPVCIEELPFLIAAVRNIGLEFVYLSRISSFYLKVNNVPFSTILTVKSSKDDEPPL